MYLNACHYQIDIEINLKDIEELTGYIHEYDGLQHAFMHKSSEPKFSIPFNNPSYNGMPNQYHFKISSKSVKEPRDSFCLQEEEPADNDINNDTKQDCYIKHLENILGCQLPWDGSKNECKLKQA